MLKLGHRFSRRPTKMTKTIVISIPLHFIYSEYEKPFDCKRSDGFSL